MIQISANVAYEGVTPDIAAKEFNTVKRAAYLELGEDFHANNLPRRFTWSGGRMLGFTPRSAKYEKRKRKKYGHADPNVATGTSRDQATKIRDLRATATSKTTRLRIVLHARALNFKHPKSQVHPADEVRRIAEREVPPMVRKLAGFIDRQFSQLPSNTRSEKV